MRLKYTECPEAFRDAGWRAGVEAMRDAFITDMKKSWEYEPGQSISTEIVKGKLVEASAWAIPISEETAARLLAEGEGERRCLLCDEPMPVGPPTCPRCGGHAWKVEGEGGKPR